RKEKVDALLTDIAQSDLEKTEKKEAEELIFQITNRALDLDLEQILRLYTKLAHLFEHNGVPEEHARNLASMFSSKKEVFEYLADFANINNKTKTNQIMHDACSFVLPSGAPNEIKKWKKLATTKQEGRAY